MRQPRDRRDRGMERGGDVAVQEELMMRQEVCRLAKIADDEGGQGRHESIHVTASGCVGLPVFMLVGMTVRIVMTGFCGLSAMVVDERPRGGVQQEFEEHVRMGVRRPSPVRHGRADECEAEEDQRGRMVEEANHARANL